jgi:hypothetical protein
MVVAVNGDGTLSVNGLRVTRDEVVLGGGYSDREQEFLIPLFDESDAWEHTCTV